MEVLIAFTVMVLAVVGLVSVTVSSINSTDFAKKQSVATSQARKAMEAIRNGYYSQNWTDFKDNCQTLGESQLVGLPDYFDPSTEDNPQVECNLEGEAGVDIGMKATIIVRWHENDKNHQAVLEDFFAKK